MSAPELYEEDFYEWTVRNAELLRTGRASEADLANIAEELESMARRERRELLLRLSNLITHLLKWQYQTDRRSRSWEGTIRLQRKDLASLLEEMPSLQPYVVKNLADAYDHALVIALVETRLPESDLPSSCPFAFEALLDPDYLP